MGHSDVPGDYSWDTSGQTIIDPQLVSVDSYGYTPSMAQTQGLEGSSEEQMPDVGSGLGRSLRCTWPGCRIKKTFPRETELK